MAYMNHWLKWIGILMLLALVGCNTSFNTAPIATPTIVSQPTPLPATPLPTIAPTSTIMPTLSPAEAEAKVLDLLHDNGGCRLPCFWGFTPGQTKVREITSFLRQMGSDEGINIQRDNLTMRIQFEIGENQLAIYTKAYTVSTYERKNVYGSSNYEDYFQYYSLPNLLSAYGPPEQVFVILDTGIAGMGLGVDLYFVSIEHPQKGWMAVYEMPLQQNGDVFLGCPKEAFVNLRLWVPGDIPVDAFIGGFGGPDKSYLFTIEEATGMTLDEFYNRFKKPTNTACLETPVDIHKP